MQIRCLDLKTLTTKLQRYRQQAEGKYILTDCIIGRLIVNNCEFAGTPIFTIQNHIGPTNNPLPSSWAQTNAQIPIFV